MCDTVIGASSLGWSHWRGLWTWSCSGTRQWHHVGESSDAYAEAIAVSGSIPMHLREQHLHLRITIVRIIKRRASAEKILLSDGPIYSSNEIACVHPESKCPRPEAKHLWS